MPVVYGRCNAKIGMNALGALAIGSNGWPNAAIPTDKAKLLQNGSRDWIDARSGPANPIGPTGPDMFHDPALRSVSRIVTFAIPAAGSRSIDTSGCSNIPARF